MKDLLQISKKALTTLQHHQADITYLPPLPIIEELTEAIQEEERRRTCAESLRVQIYRTLLDSGLVRSGETAAEISHEVMAIIRSASATPDQTPAIYFMTVEWCSDGYRGIFCDLDGNPFRKAGQPHTQDEMDDILGPFTLILGAKSQPFTEQQLAEYTSFCPLAEYQNQYGIVLKPEQAKEKYDLLTHDAAKESDRHQEETP
jgi:hypothetical protein